MNTCTPPIASSLAAKGIPAMAASTTSPIVNMNGTSRDALIAQRMTAVRALHVVEDALADITVHGRDYPGDPARFEAAVAADRARFAAITTAIADLSAEVVALRRGYR